MPKPNAKKRLMKKVLDRWENEGGTLPESAANSPQTVLPDSDSDKGDKPPTASDATTADPK